jgi:predicted aspartyl protease
MRILRVVVLPMALVVSAAEAAPVEVVLSVGSSGAIRVPASVNGQGPFTFALDTGSSHTTLSREIAERLALRVVAKVRVLTPSGVETQPVVGVEHLAIEDVGIENLLPSVVSRAQLRQLDAGIDGVIGQDFLAAFDFTLDYRRKRLRWTAEAADGEERLPLVRAGDRRLVELRGDGMHSPLVMVPDSGAEGFILFERHGRTAVAVDDAESPVQVLGPASRRNGRGAWLRELRVGTLTLRHQPAVIIERDGSRALEGDGLLPLHRFSSVSFNNGEGYLVVRR